MIIIITGTLTSKKLYVMSCKSFFYEMPDIHTCILFYPRRISEAHNLGTGPARVWKGRADSAQDKGRSGPRFLGTLHRSLGFQASMGPWFERTGYQGAPSMWDWHFRSAVDTKHEKVRKEILYVNKKMYDIDLIFLSRLVRHNERQASSLKLSCSIRLLCGDESVLSHDVSFSVWYHHKTSLA